MPTVSILGCGWLGLPLAEQLLAEGYSVKGSTTRAEKLPVLTEKGINSFQIALSEQGITGNISAFLDTTEVLVLDIPPKLRTTASESFVQKIANLLPYIAQSGVKKVLFISSTAVYPDEVSYNKVTEGYIPQPETENGKQLLQAEKLLLNHSSFQTTVLRFGGLVGADRHPVNHLAGKENIANPEAPINLIHLEDCIGIIQKILETETWGEIFNAVAPYHPTRVAYYHKKATAMQLPLPNFACDEPSVGKLIASEKVQQVLQYSFRKTDF